MNAQTNRKLFIVEEDVFRYNQDCLDTFGENDVAVIDRSYLLLTKNMKKYQSVMIEQDTITRRLENYLSAIKSLYNEKNNSPKIELMPFIEVNKEHNTRFTFIKTIKLTSRHNKNNIQKMLSSGDDATAYILDVLNSSQLKRETANKYKEVVYLSKNPEMRSYATMLGINTDDYRHDTVPTDRIYNGQSLIKNVSTEVINEMYNQKYIPLNTDIEAYINEELIPFHQYRFQNCSDSSQSIHTIFHPEKKEFVEIFSQITPRGYSGYIPKGIGQKTLVYAMQQQELDIITVQGEAGTGKTYSAIYLALHHMKKSPKKYRFLYLVKPLATVNAYDMGAMPGGMEEKLNPFMRSLHNAIDDIELRSNNNTMSSFIRKLKEEEKIIVQSLPHIRGINIQDAIVVIDESQNTTRGEMKAALTRLTGSTKAIVCGDINQIDDNRKLSLSKGSSGFANLIYKLHREPEFCHIACYRNFRKNSVSKVANLL